MRAKLEEFSLFRAVLQPTPVDIDASLLAIQSPTSSLTSPFMVRITSPTTSPHSNDFTVCQSFLVVVPPTAVVAPSRIELNEGDSTELRCVVTGSPTPLVRWSKDGGSLPRDHASRDTVIV